eukprot:GILI01009685.1.p1 GENE.GILI01009685.1~~GILI01009685.1.p1  ORF type:complete len:271 (-),score=56.61 GILI01009685.1:34-813(-)
MSSFASNKTNTRIYAFSLSQPSRAVLWAAYIHNLDFDFYEVDYKGGEASSDEYYKKFAAGGAPALEVKCDGTELGPANTVDLSTFRITECGAILTYLAEANNWGDVYPMYPMDLFKGPLSHAALQQRARIQQWLLWKESSLRFATVEVFRRVVAAKMQGKDVASALSEEEQKTVQQKWKDAMLTMTYGGLKQHAFIAGDTMTIADLVLYCEIDQIYYAGLFDFKAWPEVYAWIERMQQVPEHDSVRRTLFKFIRVPKPQ